MTRTKQAFAPYMKSDDGRDLPLSKVDWELRSPAAPALDLRNFYPCHAELLLDATTTNGRKAYVSYLADARNADTNLHFDNTTGTAWLMRSSLNDLRTKHFPLLSKNEKY
jgi:hypothetical protein